MNTLFILILLFAMGYGAWHDYKVIKKDKKDK